MAARYTDNIQKPARNQIMFLNRLAGCVTCAATSRRLVVEASVVSAAASSLAHSAPSAFTPCRPTCHTFPVNNARIL